MFLGGSKSALEEEMVQSPSLTALMNFCSKKLAVAGVAIFALIVLACVILPAVYPLDINFMDTTQSNIAPGFFFLDVPKELQGKAAMIDTGASFGAALDQDGNVYQWGKLAGNLVQEKLYRRPEGMGALKSISCGQDHILALGQDGKIYTWGNDRMNLTKIPKIPKGVNIVEVKAGIQISAALGDDGKLYIWGNENLIKISPRLAGNKKILSFDLNPYTAIALLEDNTVKVMTNNELSISKVPEELQGKAIQVAASKESAAGVSTDGKVYVWGSKEYGLQDIPEDIQGHVKSVSAGRYHYSVLLDDGSLRSWGMGNFGQDSAPETTNAVSVSSDYFSSAAILSNGNVVTWGMKGYLLGSDQYGRDMFRRLISGGRITLSVGAISVVIAGIIGILLGGISGFYGGRTDMLLMRFAEIVNAIPFLPLAIILSSIIGNRISEDTRIVMIMLILGLLSWPGLARLTRAQILAERENEFVTAAKAMGVKETNIIFRHILPNVLAVVLVNLTLNLATCMLIEATLSYLGFGVLEPRATWGNMLYACNDSTVITKFWWRWVFPSAALGLATISVNIVGDSLRDAIDPKSNDR
jgi:peptide/nickel transport system permease protein